MKGALAARKHVGGGPLPLLLLRGRIYKQFWAEFGLRPEGVDDLLLFRPLVTTEWMWLMDLLVYERELDRGDDD